MQPVILFWLFLSHGYICKKIEWNSYSSNYYHNSDLIQNQAYIDIDNEGGKKNKRFLLCVNRFIKGHPKNHIIVIPDGPGLPGSTVEASLDRLVGFFGNDFVLYIPDMRGTGRSSPFSGEPGNYREAWTKEKSSDGRLLLKSVTMERSVQDILSIARQFKDDSIFPKNAGNLILVGLGWGAAVAQQAIHEDSKLFTSALLERLPSRTPEWFATTADAGFMEACETDEFCRKMVDGSAQKLRTLILAISSQTDLNSCTKELNEYLQKESRLTRYHQNRRFLAFMTPFLRNQINNSQLPKKYPSSMLIPPFLTATFACEDASKYRSQVFDPMRRLFEATASSTPRPFTFGNAAQSVERPVNSLLMATEVFDYSIETPASCAEKGGPPLGFASPCNEWLQYREIYRELTKKKKLDIPSVRYPRQLRAENTRIIFTHGSMDLLVPVGPIRERFKNDVVAKSKSLYQLKYHSGGLLLEGAPCQAEIVADLLGSGSSSAVNSCLGKADGAAALDWKFQNLTIFGSSVASWWPNKVQSISKPPLVDDTPKKPEEGRLSGLMIGLIVACSVLGVLLLAVGLSFLAFWWRQRKQQSNNKL